MPVPSPLSRHHNSNADSRSADGAEKPVRPPPRANNPSLELEPNPFEVSFSTPQTVPSRNNSSSHRLSPSSEDKKPSSTASSPTQGSGSDNSRRNSSNGSHPTGDTPKPILPPLAAITSPSDPSYSWQFSNGLSNSLRSGPLSPAMLAGPQTQSSTSQAASSSIQASLFGFDPSGTFRTGLTPSTGLTPLVGGPVSFPLPSPNTAAFIAMYNSNTAASSSATITPNTLSALTGVLSQHTATSTQQSTNNGSTGVQPSSTNGSGPSQATSIAPSQMAGSATTSATNSSYQNGNSPTQQRYASDAALLFSQTEPDNSSSKPYVHTPTSATNHAANGLFLLSQAHQELTKREEAQKQSMAQSSSNSTSNESRSDIRAASNGSSNVKRGSKRKSDNASVSSSTSNKASVSKKTKTSTSSNSRTTRRSSAAASASNPELDDEDEEDEESDDEPAQAPQSASSKSKKPETEEEKRKNFLERNRQAALKCRQRKKAWLAQLQAKVEFLTNENERLSAALVSSREEISRLSQLVGGAGVGLPVSSGVGVGVPLVGVGINGVQHQPVHASYMTAHQQQQHHPISLPVSVQQAGSAASPPMGVKTSPLIHTQQVHSQHSHSPHSPSSEGRSSRSSIRDVRDYGNSSRDSNGRDYARDMRERELSHVHAHAPQAVTVNGRGYGY